MMLNTVLKVYVPVQAFVAHQAKLFLKRTDGASGIEYAIVVVMVAVVIATLSPGVGTAVEGVFTKIKDSLKVT